MKKAALGVISFQRYEVDSVIFKLNRDYKDEEVSIDINTEAEITIDDDEMLVKLTLDVFPDAISKGYPFEMQLILNGYFALEVTDGSDIKEYQANALAILYPYARAIVSSYTANANVTPLILPTININKMLMDHKEEV